MTTLNVRTGGIRRRAPVRRQAMRRPFLVAAALLAAALAGPASAHAQVAWDSPYLMPPKARRGLGLYLVDVPGGDLGVMGTWRSSSYNFGIRGGLVDTPGEDLGIFAGVDFLGMLTRSTTEFPLDIDWLMGIGMGVSHGALISAPAGLTIGHDFSGEGVGFTPFISPRVVLDACLDCRRRADNDLSLDFAVDVGLDLRLTSALTIRFGATLGDRDGVGIGLVF